MRRIATIGGALALTAMVWVPTAAHAGPMSSPVPTGVQVCPPSVPSAPSAPQAPAPVPSPPPVPAPPAAPPVPGASPCPGA
jgi:hypothetical protein